MNENQSNQLPNAGMTPNPGQPYPQGTNPGQGYYPGAQPPYPQPQGGAVYSDRKSVV